MPAGAGTTGFGRAARWFPLVGAGLGGITAVAAWGLDLAAAPPPLAAWLLVGFCAWITGGLHLDGLADVADGFGGGRSREDVLRIMRDPSIGAFGATALLVLLGIKAGALTALLERDAAIPVLVAAPVLARWTAVALGTWLPSARPDGGLGDTVTRSAGWVGLVVASSVTAAVVVAALRVDGLVLWILAALVTAALGRAARRRIGGVTGDVFGAGVELTETTVLVGAVLLRAHA
jgi:cobalamin 5'-phosphate synthase/cobalamin synthase